MAFDHSLHYYRPGYNRNPASDKYVKRTDHYITFGNEAKIRGSNIPTFDETIIVGTELPTGDLVSVTMYVAGSYPVKLKIFKKTATHFLFIKEKSFSSISSKTYLQWNTKIEPNYYLSFYIDDVFSPGIYRESTGDKIYILFGDRTSDELISDYNLHTFDLSLEARILHKTTYEVK